MHRSGLMHSGVRQALGTRPGDVSRLVVGRAIRYDAPGLAVGLALALLAIRWVGPLLFDVSPRDPMVYGTVGVTLLGAAAVAAFGPARRARRVDPVVALRDE
ncbi:MAG: FtsX-like permease family protein [Gemmatimonadaceae bacterium]